jgi:hypothetical protein
VLNAKSSKDAMRSIIHTNGDREVKLAHWRAKQVAHGGVKVQTIGHAIELCARDVETALLISRCHAIPRVQAIHCLPRYGGGTPRR